MIVKVIALTLWLWMWCGCSESSFTFSLTIDPGQASVEMNGVSENELTVVSDSYQDAIATVQVDITMKTPSAEKMTSITPGLCGMEASFSQLDKEIVRYQVSADLVLLRVGYECDGDGKQLVQTN